MAHKIEPIWDCLYGNVVFERPIANLISKPLVQRLRQVRLSNIDSLATPGIANVSRYEHALGTARLASQAAFADALTLEDRIQLQAAALIHDTGITPFGHLMEEAFSYVNESFNHETKWKILLEGGGTQPGGIDLQLYLGFTSGLREWAHQHFGSSADAALDGILASINGKGKFGAAIAGDLDFDNLDNVCRAAYHMGLDVDRTVPIQIVRAMEGINRAGSVVFGEQALAPLAIWLGLREEVYTRFMLPPEDFVGKIMLLYATVEALKSGILGEADWSLTDSDYLHQLLKGQKEIADAVKRWMIADVWDLSDLIWFAGKPPSFHSVQQFAMDLSKLLKRSCFAYRIKDKRKRSLKATLVNGTEIAMGEDPSAWVLGVGSPIKKPFTAFENATIATAAEEYFKAELAPFVDPRLFA